MNKRVTLDIGKNIHSDKDKGFDYIVEGTIGTGANCIVYKGKYTDNSGNSHRVIIKECYPYKSDVERLGDDLNWKSSDEESGDKSRFNNSYRKLCELSENDTFVNETSASIDLVTSNNTLYSITEYKKAKTFANTDYQSSSALNGGVAFL